MTVGVDKLNALFRDFKVAEDVSKMMELRRFEIEYTMYGSMFLENGKVKYIVSGNKDKIVSFINDRKNFMKYPFPVMKHTVKTLVPSGTEEDIVRMVKVNLAKNMREHFSSVFLRDFYALAANENDDSAKEILDELQMRLYGMYRAENLLLFEGLMDFAYRAKHIKESTCKKYEFWLNEEWRQMEDMPELEDQFSKELYGFASKQNEKIKVYYNAEKAKVYEKSEMLSQCGYLVSHIYTKRYWYNYDKTLKDIRMEFHQLLENLFDETYFSYLQKIADLPSTVDKERIKWMENKYCQGNTLEKNVIDMYKVYWK